MVLSLLNTGAYRTLSHTPDDLLLSLTSFFPYHSVSFTWRFKQLY